MSNVATVQNFLSTANLDAALFAAPSSITYLTGVRAAADYDAPWGWAPAVCFVPVEGEAVAVLPDLFEGVALPFSDVTATLFPSYRIDMYPQPRQALVDVLLPLIDGIRRLGVESGALPWGVVDSLLADHPQAQVEDVSGELETIRRVKSPEEIQLLRTAVQLTCLGQETARQAAAAGRSEIEIFTDVRSAMEIEAGSPLTDFVADFVGGTRTAQVGGPPGTYVLEAGDAILSDLVFCLDGYWGDTTSTFAVEHTDETMRTIHQIAWDALRTGRDAIRPGLQAKELDALVRGYVEDNGYAYPHHTGHGLGVGYHEQPILTPWNEMPLEAGMVLVLEPGIYLDDTAGVRLEDAFVVTEDGCEQLSDHRKDLI